MPLIRTIRDVAATIRGRRLERGWTQAELADRARVSRSWLIELEAAKKTTAEIGRVLQVLDALGVELMTADGPRDAQPITAVDLDAHLAQYQR